MSTVVSGRGLATNVTSGPFPRRKSSDRLHSSVESVHHCSAVVRLSEIESTHGEYNRDLYDPSSAISMMPEYRIVAVVEGAPDWALNRDQRQDDCPSSQCRRFASFLTEFVRRMVRTLPMCRFWDRPNDPAQLVGAGATPDQYVGLLAPAFNAVRTANGMTQVILSEFADRDASGTLGSDIRFLEGIYSVGGAPYFDAVAAAIDGGVASPYDRRVASRTPSLSRAVLFRELLLEKGDDTKPVWITHYGWDLSPDIDRTKQAEYLVAGIERIRTEWPWAGPVFQWALLPQQAEAGNENRALLQEDGTSTVSFQSVVGLADNGIGTVAPTGFVPWKAAGCLQWRLERSTSGRPGFQDDERKLAHSHDYLRGNRYRGIFAPSPDAGMIAQRSTVAIARLGNEDGA